jgi:hypothetical protein
MNKNGIESYQSKAFLFGAGFWYLAAVGIKNTKELNVFGNDKTIYHLISAPLIAKLGIFAMKKLVSCKDQFELYHSVAISGATAFLLDGLVISLPSLRKIFYGTDGDFTLQAGWLFWGAGNLILCALLE